MTTILSPTVPTRDDPMPVPSKEGQGLPQGPYTPIQPIFTGQAAGMHPALPGADLIEIGIVPVEGVDKFGFPQGVHGREGHSPQMVGMYFTAMEASRYISKMQQRTNDVLPMHYPSTHYFVSYQGHIYQLLDESDTSWALFGSNARRSDTWPLVDPSYYYVTIGLEGSPSTHLPQRQRDSLSRLIAVIAHNNNIPVDTDYLHFLQPSNSATGANELYLVGKSMLLGLLVAGVTNQIVRFGGLQTPNLYTLKNLVGELVDQVNSNEERIAKIEEKIAIFGSPDEAGKLSVGDYLTVDSQGIVSVREDFVNEATKLATQDEPGYIVPDFNLQVSEGGRLGVRNISARYSASRPQSVSAGTPIAVNYDTKMADNYQIGNSSGGSFKAVLTHRGVYDVTPSILLDPRKLWADDAVATLYIYVNGSEYQTLEIKTPGQSNRILSLSGKGSVEVGENETAVVDIRFGHTDSISAATIRGGNLTILYQG